jgi:hypothetical protein
MIKVLGLSKLERSKLKGISYKLLLLKKKYRYEFTGNYKNEDDFTLIRFQNDGSEVFNAQREVSSGLIQFHFGLKEAPNLSSTKGITPRFKEEKSYCFTIHKRITFKFRISAQLLGICDYFN